MTSSDFAVKAPIERASVSPLDYAISERDRETLTMVRQAIARRDVVLAYQPIVQTARPDRQRRQMHPGQCPDQGQQLQHEVLTGNTHAQQRSELAHGERRQLELAMVLVADPKLLLLDEPMAGMSHQESGKVVDMLRALKGRYTILLVEHDMDAVFALADRLTVMVNGQVIASGTPAEVRADTAVQAAYLGEEH